MKINEYKVKQILKQVNEVLEDSYNSDYILMKDKRVLVAMAKIETLLDLIEFEEEK